MAHLDLVPVFSGEGILGLLLETLLSLRKPFIFSNSHSTMYMGGIGGGFGVESCILRNFANI